MRIKNILAVAMTAGMMMTFIPTTSLAATTGWQGSNTDGWRYYTSDTEYVKNSWKKIGGKWYYFDASGYMKTGWLEENKNWYYLDESGAMVVNSWEKIGGKLYHFAGNGAMDTNKWIAYDDVNLVKVEDVDVIFHRDYKGKKMWRYVGANGAAYTGWKIVDGQWYFFDEFVDKNKNNGDALNDLILYNNEDRYGAMRYGWMTDNNDNIYFFDGNGKYKRNGWYELKLTDSVTAWFYFASDGRAYTKWHQIDGSWYYFDEDVGDMYENGFTYIDGDYYYFKPNGQMVTGWYKDYRGYWYCARANGKLYYREWLNENGKWYYFNGAGMVCNRTNMKINGKYYDFDSHGVCTNPSGRANPA
ncbi:hypothetical protein [Butyrivibrio sp. AE2032]|uniref:hypothetical protein n=1 Tax=Butyrivibrio sp. AE2032 TaxID=1458463 RepID=UPI00055353E6|nr:hypothetical protein [Butyrivibrio sp. AE2032]